MYHHNSDVTRQKKDSEKIISHLKWICTKSTHGKPPMTSQESEGY
jgi:hypothetical protein